MIDERARSLVTVFLGSRLFRPAKYKSSSRVMQLITRSAAREMVTQGAPAPRESSRDEKRALLTM